MLSRQGRYAPKKRALTSIASSLVLVPPKKSMRLVACVHSCTVQLWYMSLNSLLSCTTPVQLSVLEFNEDSNQIDAAGVYRHPNQIWAIEPSPNQSDLVITSSQSALTSQKELTLFRMPQESQANSTTETNENMKENDNPDYESQDQTYNSGDLLDLETVSSFQFQDPSTFVHSVKWHSVSNQVLTLDPHNLTSWAVTEAEVKVSNYVVSHMFDRQGRVCSILIIPLTNSIGTGRLDLVWAYKDSPCPVVHVILFALLYTLFHRVWVHLISPMRTASRSLLLPAHGRLGQ